MRLLLGGVSFDKVADKGFAGFPGQGQLQVPVGARKVADAEDEPVALFGPLEGHEGQTGWLDSDQAGRPVREHRLERAAAVFGNRRGVHLPAAHDGLAPGEPTPGRGEREPEDLPATLRGLVIGVPIIVHHIGKHVGALERELANPGGGGHAP